MKFSIAGTGNMAWFLAHRLTMSGHQCLAVFGRDRVKTEELATSVNSTATSDPSDIKRLPQEAVILAVSDHAIGEMATALTSKNTVLIHTSGATEISLLDASPAHGVIWPIYSILKQQMPRHREIPCAIAASDPHTLSVVRNLAHGFSDTVFEANDLQRQWLHLAAVIGNNFVNHLMAIDEMICNNQSLPFSVLQPILLQTFSRIQTDPPAILQTGPAARNDEETIGKHLSLLAIRPEWQEVYQAMTASIQKSQRHTSTDNPVKD